MDRYTLSHEEEEVYNLLSQNLRVLPEASQYNVLRNLAHAMDREVVRIGSIRAAAAVAGSTARIIAEGNEVKKASSKSSKKGSTRGGYPQAFKEGAGRALIAAQATAKAAMSEPPTEEQKSALRAASIALREGFRRFKESETA